MYVSMWCVSMHIHLCVGTRGNNRLKLDIFLYSKPSPQSLYLVSFNIILVRCNHIAVGNYNCFILSTTREYYCMTVPQSVYPLSC